MLHRGVDGEHIELVHLAKLRHERCGRCDKADLPAGNVVGLAKAGDDDAARCQTGITGGTFVLHAVKHHVLVHLVADHKNTRGRQQVL